MYLIGKILKVNQKDDYSIEFIPTGSESSSKGMYCKRLSHIVIPPKKDDTVLVFWDDLSTMGFYLPIMNDYKISIMNDREDLSLKTILIELLDNLINLQTIGSAPQHKVAPDSIAKLTQTKQKIEKIFDE